MPANETILPNLHPRRGSAITAKLAIAAAILASPSAVAAPDDKHHGATHHHAPAGHQQIPARYWAAWPIPPACAPVAGKTLGGRPTGYDVIVCPPDVRPLQ